MRYPIIAGNWKMNNTQKEAKALTAALVPLVKDALCEVVLCVPFTDIAAVKKLIRGTNIKLGAQNVHFAENGAYTGEISAAMLKEMKVEYVIVGHSERRRCFGETDETVNKRAAAALAAKLKPIVCVGETLEEREEGRTESVLLRQLAAGLYGFKGREFDKLVIAYEPVWAIGTGKTATKEDANETIGYIRRVVARKFGKPNAEKVRIQYGGSMNAKNAAELLAMPEIDGGLIGGASLSAEDFAKVAAGVKA
jgi:triosephosphate isomerase